MAARRKGGEAYKCSMVAWGTAQVPLKKSYMHEAGMWAGMCTRMWAGMRMRMWAGMRKSSSWVWGREAEEQRRFELAVRSTSRSSGTGFTAPCASTMGAGEGHVETGPRRSLRMFAKSLRIQQAQSSSQPS